MWDLLRDVPGRIFVVAAGLPLLAFCVLLLSGFLHRVRNRRTNRNPHAHDDHSHGNRHPVASPAPSILPGYFAVACMMLAAAAAFTGTIWYFQDLQANPGAEKSLESRWSERIEWIELGASKNPGKPAQSLYLGYHVDRLSALLVCMVTVIGSLIFLFSMGYMHEELQPDVHDHAAHVHRSGRFGRFFLYLSLFAFSMLNLLLADNLLQVFVGWELVGVCSFFLIGFYYERQSASTAANKAFIMNRIGDAGFLVGLAVAWTQFGTFNIQELIRIASQDGDNPALTLLSLGILAGCIGKSAQVPLQTWLPDAMEGPTPVSALIHAATMVAAGVYLAGRTLPLFTTDVLELTVIVGLITLFMSATIACVQTDIKRVLAYSTCSQLGFMMLALGLGGWVAGLLHLLTHAFFKALLFLGAGAVIYGLHHEQDLAKMGGLRRKMPITAYTMLIGVFAIAGVPLFSGWYSKDMILSQVAGAALGSEQRPFLFAIPFLTAGLTSYYMFRLWFLAFAGEPRDRKVHEHAHEAPRVMTVPLMILALFSVGIAWGWPIWDVEKSLLGQVLHAGEPAGLESRFSAVNHRAHEQHLLAGGLALFASVFGFGFAYMSHRSGTLLAKGKPSLFRKFLLAKWCFDLVYDRLMTRPTMRLASGSAAFDKRPNDGKKFDTGTLDGAINSFADLANATGTQLRSLQTGRLREYALALGLTVVLGLGILIRLTR